LARLEPIHLKSSTAGIEVVRGTVYAEGYKVWNYDTGAWDEISLTAITSIFEGDVINVIKLASGTAERFYVNSLTANSIWGQCVDDDTIGINEDGQLYVKRLTPSMINYPFGLDSLTFTTLPSSVAFRFREADAATGNGTITSQNVSWNLDDNYAISGAGVNALSATFYKIYHDYADGGGESAYTTTITPPYTSKEFTVVITCSGYHQINILSIGEFESLFFYVRCQVGDTTHYDWGESNNPYEMPAQTKRFVLPSYALTSETTNAITKQDIINAGNPTLAAYYRGTYTTYTPTYTDDSQGVYIWFIVPYSHCNEDATIYQNTALEWYSIPTTYVDTLSLGEGANHTFTYKMFRSTNLQSPADSFNAQYRLYW